MELARKIARGEKDGTMPLDSRRSLSSNVEHW